MLDSQSMELLTSRVEHYMHERWCKKEPGRLGMQTDEVSYLIRCTRRPLAGHGPMVIDHDSSVLCSDYYSQ